MKIFQDKTVDLDLNGPILSFTTEPTGVGSTGVGINSTGGGSVDLIGIATVTFPNSANNDGYVTYRWHEQGVGALSDSTYVTGTATTTLTLSNLITPTDNQRKFYVQADYVPPYDGTTATYTTGNALNEPFNSGLGTVTVDPLIEIVAQPTSQTTLNNSSTGVYETGKFVSLTVDADLTDSYFADDLTYQWFIDGEAATDEVRTKTTTTGSTSSGPVNNTYTSQSEHIFPSVQIDSLEITVAAAGGASGGSDAGGPGGGGTHGYVGRFSLPSSGFLGKKVDMFIGYRGNSGRSGGRSAFGAGGSLPGGAARSGPGGGGQGGRGGGAGQHGWSGGGGGGGAATYVENAEGRIIVAGGGGGGGGGSLRIGGQGAAGGSGFSPNNGPFDSSDGAAGETKNGDGGGGGGGGGGAPGGSGGGSGQDQAYGGRAGTPGGSRYNSNRATLLNQFHNHGNGYVNISYTGYTSTQVTTTRKTSISGSTTSTLKVACDTVGIQTAQCKISSATASNSYIMTDEVTAVFVSTAAANEIKIEAVGNTTTASLSDIDLNNGEYTFNLEGVDADNNGINQYYVLYSPNKDMDVEMDLYGGQGLSGSGNNGGEGGYSRIRFTLEQNQEYVIAGLISSINAPFVYRRGTLMACVGKGGDMTQSGSGNGGAGGGVNIGGASGTGNRSGNGGATISSGSLGGNGIFGSTYSAPEVYPGDTQATGNDGGRTIKCTKGGYWRRRGIGACDDVPASNKFRLSDGTIVTNTTDSISRGFKTGYNIMQTAGVSLTSNGGNGGNGASGGQGAASNGGGGGGSGYQDGTVTVVSTQLGGSTNDAKVILRLQS